MAWYGEREPGLEGQSHSGEQTIKIDATVFDTAFARDSNDPGEEFGRSSRPDSPSLLRVNPGAVSNRNRSRTPSDSFASRNPFRRASPVSPYGDLTSEFGGSSQPSLLSERQIQMEELEMEELELELKLRKLNLRKKKLQLEAQESQRRDAERRAERQSQQILYSPVAIVSATQEIERQDLARRHFLEAEQQMQRGIETQTNKMVRAEAERAKAEQMKAEKLAAERAEAKRVEVERVEMMRVAAERAEAERIEAERIEVERIEAERIEAERIEAERIEAERIEAERIEAERIEAQLVVAEKEEARKIEAARAEMERLEAEQNIRQRIETDANIQRLAKPSRRTDEERASDKVDIAEDQKLDSRREEALQPGRESIRAKDREQVSRETERKRESDFERLHRQRSARIALNERQQAERDLLEAELFKESSDASSRVPQPAGTKIDTKPSAETKARAISWDLPISEGNTDKRRSPDLAENTEVSVSEGLSLIEQQGNVAKERRSSSFSRSERVQDGNLLDKPNSTLVVQSHQEDAPSDSQPRDSLTTASENLEASTDTSFTSPSGSMLSSQTDEERAWEIAAEGSLSTAKLRQLPSHVQDELKLAMESHMPKESVDNSKAPSRNLSKNDTPSQRPPVPPKPTRSPPPTPVHRSSPENFLRTTNPKSPEHKSHTTKPLVSASPKPSLFTKQSRPHVSPNPFIGFDSETAESVDEDWCSCGKVRPSVEECYFCWPCDGTIFCKDCWDTCPPHRKNRMRILHKSTGLPHEKTDPAVAKKIFQTLQSDRDHEEQALLHVQDEDTSWFGAGRDEEDDVVFQDFGRYARLMAEKSVRGRRVRYPSLVSFVGQTGAGKSSLIRLLIELYSSDGTKPQVPVVGSNLHQDVPTSGDVHLYADPKTFKGDNPTLYADCEGLDGGEREPMGARARNKKDSKDKRSHSFIKHIRKQHHTSERELVWARTPETRSREYHVRHLYPRLLYTFSDVIVFVMKNPRVIENAIEQLIKWAEAALETSSNQPVLPHAVIVLNASDNASDPTLWDVNNATVSLMESVRRAVHQNHSMRKFAETWRQRGRTVETVEMLLLSYYSSVRVVRVPERGRPNLINDQLQKLYLEIAEACVRARDSKNDVRMLLNSDELQPYLQYAFDHFSRDLETPFDFVQASFANNPIPANFGGNILKLAINIMEVWKDNLDGPNIFNELSFMVASCIMVDSARHRTLGPADKVFDGYIEFCDSALDEFCNRHWPCEYVHPGTQGRCVNVKAGHQSKGHQLVSGKLLTVGAYESTFTTINYQSLFRWKVYMNLHRLLEKLRIATTTSPHLEPQKAADIHRDIVLKDFYRHLSGSKEFISHTSCFSCLIAPPEHALPCGHVLCTPCVQAFGKARGRYIIEMRYCPLHSEDSDGQFTPNWPIVIKPSCAGVRILSLDGGGIRGIIELMIMQEIEKALGPGLPIQAFFDLIVGTSTGGIIALGLGANGWTVQKCISHFESLCREAFTRRGLALPGIEWISSNFSRYETKPIEQVLKLVFGDHNLFAGSKVDMDDPRVTQRLTKVAVTATTTAGTAAVLANYNRMETSDDQPYQFHRSEKPNVEIKTWQAARATSAAPTMFKPFAHEPSGQVYQDGCLWCNCPVEVAMREWRLIWPDVADTYPDIVLSIGTGINPKARKRIAGKISRFGLFSQARALANVAIDKVEASLNSQKTWRNFLERNPVPEHIQGRFIRMNLELDKDPPKMDEVRSLEELKERALSQFTARKREVKNLADRLIATSFFFVQDEQVAAEDHDDDSITIAGFIMCRFSPASEEIRSLGETLRSRLRSAYPGEFARHNPYFVVRERGKHHKATQLTLDAEAVEKMRDIGIFSFDRVHIHLSDKRVETEILFCIGDQPSHAAFYPISGLPRCLMEDFTKGTGYFVKPRIRSLLTYSTGNRLKAPTTPHKKTPAFDPDMAAFEARKAVWRFSPDDVTKGKDPFELYGSPGYSTPGNVSLDTMSKISQRYSTITQSNGEFDVPYRDSTLPPPIPAKYFAPHGDPTNFTSYGGDNVSELSSFSPQDHHNGADGPYRALLDTLLDPASELVRRQLISLLGAPRFALSFRPHAIPLGALPLWRSDFVCASDQYRLGFYTKAEARQVTDEVLEMV